MHKAIKITVYDTGIARSLGHSHSLSEIWLWILCELDFSLATDRGTAIQ